jgi:[acyl-carrier-protein] S-malonyltransferase
MTLAILCSGQGHQHAGMLELVRHDAAACAVIDEARHALGADPLAWLLEPGRLTENAIAQPLICVAQLAVWRALQPSLPRADVIAGYSIGELTSYACAGALDTIELCRLAQARAEAMDAAARDRPGTLAAIRGLGSDVITALCDGRDAWPSIIIDGSSCVVGGTLGAIDAVIADARRHGADAQRLPVGVAAHTPLLAAAADSFRSALASSSLGHCQTPVVSGVRATLVAERSDAIDALACQVAQTVDWAGVLRMLIERGCRVFFELGPGSALSRGIRSRFADVDARAFDDFRSLAGIVGWIRSRLG